MTIIDELPDQSKLDLDKLWVIFPKARLVGGVVRDLIAGKVVSDIDVATPEPPELILDQLKIAGIKVIPTGISHGTVTALFDHRSYEITTLRKDVEMDGRHAKVCWTKKWHEDAARRDFTINALYCDRKGKIWDYFHGQEDLKRGHVRFVGAAKARISEDYLRILRYFRFYARYGKGEMDAEAVEAIQLYASYLNSLSAERLWLEFQKIIIGPKVVLIMKEMDFYGVLPVLIPLHYDLDLFNQLINKGVPADAILRLAGLVKDHVLQLAKRFKLSNKDAKILSNLNKSLPLSIENTEKQLIQLRASYPLTQLIGRSWLEQMNDNIYSSELWDQWRERVNKLSQPLFPIRGQDLIKLGIEIGPVLGEYLDEVKNWWMEGGCIASAQECLEWFKSHSLKRLN